MVSQGAGGFSVRKVAFAADVSLGHLQHYFPTRAALLDAMVESLENDFYSFYVENIAPIANPVERFVACAGYVLDKETEDDLVPLLREFWVLAVRDEAVAHALNDFYQACRRFAAKLLLEANADLEYEEARRRSCTAVCMLSGAFLYLDPWAVGHTQDGFREHLLELMSRLPFQHLVAQEPPGSPA